jgi:spore coat protein U-like protein
MAALIVPIGMGLTGYGVLFQPRALTPEILTSSLAIQAVTGSLHTFTLDVGKWGTNRQTVMIGNSADLVELKFYSDAARTTLLYSTKSGGVSVVGSYQDRAMWPYDNTDAVNSSAIYGTLKVMSAAAVGSDTISVRGFWDRVR